jgi:hypothetical protein
MRHSLLALVLLACAPIAATTFVPREAHASVSIAVGWEALVKDADSVVVVTPVEAKSVWEDGRIYSYTRVKVDQGVAGELATGSETWIRTMGGVVGKIGQLVDGEPVFVNGKQSLLFLHKFQTGAVHEVSARAQGQYPIVLDDASKIRKVIRNANVGVLFPPKPNVTETELAKNQANGTAAQTSTPAPAKIVLASEMIHDRPVDDVVRDVAAAWKKAHPR